MHHHEDGAIDCKPAAGSLAIMPDGRILYLNRSDSDGPVPSKGHQLFVR